MICIMSNLHHCTKEQKDKLLGFGIGKELAEKYGRSRILYEPELLDMLPWAIDPPDDEGAAYLLNIGKGNDFWQVMYENGMGDTLHIADNPSLSVAAADMLIYLLENKYMTL